MKLIILAAGYGTRMYPLTINKTKALLLIKNKLVLDYIIERIDSNLFNEIIIVTNQKFYEDFLDWKKSYAKNITIISDGSTSPENALGWPRDLELGLENINEDFLVISSDNVFGFSLSEMVKQFNNTPLIAITKVESLEKAKKHGIVELRSNQIVSFEEKPIKPKSITKSILCYLFPSEFKGLIKEYVKEKSKQHLIEWLLERTKINSFYFNEYCHDIGDLQKYQELCEKGF